MLCRECVGLNVCKQIFENPSNDILNHGIDQGSGYIFRNKNKTIEISL